MRFCQPCLSWICAGIFARRSLREMLGYRGRIRNEPLAHAYRQIVDKRIGARRMPPNDWPDVRGLDVSDLAQLDSAEPDPGKRRLDCERRGQMLEEHATLAAFEDVPCIVYKVVVVLGFQLRVSNLHCMRDLSEPLVSAWTRMHELGILGGPADTDTRHPCRAGARQGRREAADPRP